MAHQLYRTNISLTGNVKLGCWLGNDREVTRCALAPISHILPIIPQEVNMIGSVGLGYDMKKFYDSHSDIFYSPQISDTYTTPGQYKHLTDEDFLVDPNLGDGQYGLKRVSWQKNGKQLSLFAPVFIRYGGEIPAGVRFIIQTGSGLRDIPADEEKKIGTGSDYREKTAVTPNTFIRKVSVPIKGTPLGDYLIRSYRGVNGVKPDGSDDENIHIINIDPANNRCVTRGWSMKSGDVCEVQSDLMNRIFSMGLTFREFNSYICEEYQTYQMVCPWILNLCWYFDIDDLLPATEDILYGEALRIDAEYIDANGDVIPSGDLDMNHRYICPDHQFAPVGVNDNDAMSWLDEWRVKDIWYDLAGSISPITNKWALSGSYNSYIFNTYPGFDKNNKGWYITYFIDQFESDPMAAESNPTGWIRHLSSHAGCTGKFNISDALYKSGSYSYSIFDVYYNEDISSTGRGTKDIIIRYNDNNDWMICNGAKFIIDYDKALDLIRTDTPEGSKIDWNGGDVIIGKNNTLWSISETYNSIDIDNEKPVYIILYNASDNIIKEFDVIIWFPKLNPTDDLADFTAKKLAAWEIPELDTYIVECNDNKVVPWVYSYAGKKNIFGEGNIFKYIPTSSIPVSSTLESQNSSDIIRKSMATGINNEDGVIDSRSVNFNIKYLNTTSDESVMSRYFGWVQPRISPLGSISYTKKDDHVEYTRQIRNPKGDPAEDWCFVDMRDVEDFIPSLSVGPGKTSDDGKIDSGMVFGGDGCLRCVLGYGGRETGYSKRYPYGDFAFDNFIKHYYLGSRLQAGCKDNPWSRYYRDGYEYWGSLEWKCFDTSQALYLPEEVIVEVQMGDAAGEGKTLGEVKREAVEKVCLGGVSRTTAHPEYFINRIMNVYTVNIDVDINKTKYIIKFTLK